MGFTRISHDFTIQNETWTIKDEEKTPTLNLTIQKLEFNGIKKGIWWVLRDVWWWVNSQCYQTWWFQHQRWRLKQENSPCSLSWPWKKTAALFQSWWREDLLMGCLLNFQQVLGGFCSHLQETILDDFGVPPFSVPLVVPKRFGFGFGSSGAVFVNGDWHIFWGGDRWGRRRYDFGWGSWCPFSETSSWSNCNLGDHWIYLSDVRTRMSAGRAGASMISSMINWHAWGPWWGHAK